MLECTAHGYGELGFAWKSYRLTDILECLLLIVATEGKEGRRRTRLHIGGKVALVLLSLHLEGRNGQTYMHAHIPLCVTIEMNISHLFY